MSSFLDGISSVTGPLTLLAFLAVVALAVFRRSVKDQRGLEYVYTLFRDKLTKQHFYDLASDVIKRVFTTFTIVFIGSLIAFVLTQVYGDKQPIYGDYVTGGPGDDIVITRNESSKSAQDFQVQLRGNVVDGGPDDDIIVTDPQSLGIKQPNAWPRATTEQRKLAEYSIDVMWGERSTASLREKFNLRSLSVDPGDPRLGDEGIPFSNVPDGVFVYTTSHTIGRVTPLEEDVAPFPGGAVTMEMHKRRNGVYAVAGFVSAQQAGPLADPSRTQPATVVIFATPQPNAANAVAIPLGRIESVTVGKSFEPWGVDAIEVTAW